MNLNEQIFENALREILSSLEEDKENKNFFSNSHKQNNKKISVIYEIARLHNLHIIFGKYFHSSILRENKEYQLFINDFLHNRKRNIFQISSFLQLSKQLELHDIKPIFWKGIHYHLLYYPKSIPRQMGDIDLEIEPENLSKFNEIMLSLNYKSKRVAKEAVHYTNSNSVKFDVHTKVKLFKNRAPDLRRKKVKYNNHSFFVLEPHAELKLCLDHSLGHMKDQGLNLRAFLDTWLIITKNYNELELKKLQELLQNKKHKILLGSIITFMKNYTNFNIEKLNYYEKYSLKIEIPELTSQCKVARFGLYQRKRTYLKLILSSLRLIKDKTKIAPNIHDVIKSHKKFNMIHLD